MNLLRQKQIKTRHKNQATPGSSLLSMVLSVCLLTVWYWFLAGFWCWYFVSHWHIETTRSLKYFVIFQPLYIDVLSAISLVGTPLSQTLSWNAPSKELYTTTVFGLVDISNLWSLTNKDVSSCFSTTPSRYFCKDLVCSINFISIMKVEGRVWWLELSLKMRWWK